jgi:putative redox protein
MSTTTVKWIEGQQFIGIDSTKHSVILSTPGEGIGVKPSDLFLISVAACASVDVTEILAKKRLNLTKMEVTSDGEQDSDPPWTFRKIHLHFKLTGRGLNEKAVAQAIELSVEKYCSVVATVRATAPITTDYEIIEDPRVSA